MQKHSYALNGKCQNELDSAPDLIDPSTIRLSISLPNKNWEPLNEEGGDLVLLELRDGIPRSLDLSWVKAYFEERDTYDHAGQQIDSCEKVCELLIAAGYHQIVCNFVWGHGPLGALYHKETDTPFTERWPSVSLFFAGDKKFGLLFHAERSAKHG